MRIISVLAAGLSALAIGAAAEAGPGGQGSIQAGGPSGTWSGGSGPQVSRGGRSGVAFGSIGIDRRQGGRHGRHGRYGRFGRDGYHPYAGAGSAGPVEEVDPYGNGFFYGGGGRIRLRGGQPYFDYDRSYPYEWAPAARAREPEWTEEAPRAQSQRCTFENGVRVCRGW